MATAKRQVKPRVKSFDEYKAIKDEIVEISEQRFENILNKKLNEFGNSIKKEIRADITDIKKEIKTDITDIRSDIRQLRTIIISVFTVLLSAAVGIILTIVNMKP